MAKTLTREDLKSIGALLDTRFKNQDKSIDARFSELRTELDVYFRAVAQDFDVLRNRFDEVDRRLDNLARYTPVRNLVRELNAKGISVDERRVLAVPQLKEEGS